MYKWQSWDLNQSLSRTCTSNHCTVDYIKVPIKCKCTEEEFSINLSKSVTSESFLLCIFVL